MTRPNTSEDIWARIGPGVTGFCWNWLGAKRNGYGWVRFGGSHVCVHRWAYEQLVGPIPEGFHIDHLCRNRACVNPDHLEPVTPAVNIGRGLLGYELRTTCVRGHDIRDSMNVMVRADGRRRCRRCHKEDGRNFERRARAAGGRRRNRRKAA